MIRPTLDHRIPALDVLRGIAVSGILLANLAAFGLPLASVIDGTGLPTPTLREQYAMVLTQMLVTGKFRSVLAILFGVGLWLQYVKRSKTPGNWPGGYLKRTAWLGALGLVHVTALWYGDILLTYAIVAAIASVWVWWTDRQLRGLVGIGFGVMAIAGIVLLGISYNASGVDRVTAGLPTPATEIAVYGQHSYLDQVWFRIESLPTTLSSSLALVPLVLPLFALGILLARADYFSLAAPPQVRRNVLFVGLGLGIPLNGLALIGPTTFQGYDFRLAFEIFFGPVLALGYVGLGVMLAERARGPIVRVLAVVGRLALTTYLLQSVLATAVFYSWGLGWFGRLDRATLLFVAPPIWLATALFALGWSRQFALGPVEWLWRSLAEGTRLPLRSRPLSADQQP